MPPCITAATPDDALGIATVHIRSWQAAYAHILDPAWLEALSIERRAGQWQKLLADGAGAVPVAVARDDRRITGFVSHGPCRDAGAPPTLGEIMTLYALPEVWDQGIGHALLAHAAAQLQAAGCDTITLWVLTANHRGIRFYERCGFTRQPGSETLVEVGGMQVEEVAYRRPVAG